VTKIIDKKSWYKGAKKRWELAEASVRGVLDGHDYIHDIDTENSCWLLDNLIKKGHIKNGSVLDCAAGVGRVSKAVLTKFFDNVDILEQDEKFVAKCHENFANNPKIRNIYQDSMQNFSFKEKYDVIWIQWCLEDLEDQGLIKFLTNCKNALNENGLIVIKDNVAEDHQGAWEREFSKIRSDALYKEVFAQCGLGVLMHYPQPNWPDNLMRISIFVLR
jgi:protein N-terminal methyltransferase